MKFQIIVADPSWSFGDKLTMSDVKRGAEANYPTLTISEIKSLPVKDISDPDGALLALWVPSSLLQEGLDTMKAWGFNQKQTYVWVKTKKQLFLDFVEWIKKSILKHPQVVYDQFAYERAVNAIIESIGNIDLSDELSFGMGRLFRNTHEICLIGTNNNKIYTKLLNKSQRSVCFDENLKHSSKPEHLQDSLEIMFPNTQRLELFARRPRKDWVCLGNEVCNGEDIRDSLKKLL
ncbi:MAG TPA: MT-A70 family methyltransferase [Cytophagaceae bacterium]|jgi:N6-adenosine-specific RNA methylase IME4|nr:MT-A70 family methyltransferase [Cytophagaceae bacterium]